MKILKKTIQYLIISFMAVVAAVNYIIFVFPNSFAPAGIDGICTMIQDVLNINMGYLALLVNIPLLIIAYFYLNHDFTIKTTIYTIVFSATLIFLKNTYITEFCYHTESGSSTVLAPVTAGVIRGLLYVCMLKINSSGGGVDVIAAIVKKKAPHFELMNIIFIFNMMIALSSYFVYGMKLEPVICSIIYSFITSSITKHMQAISRQTVKFEIITPEAQKLCYEITNDLNASATIMDAHGAYSGKSQQLVICVVEKHQVPQLEDILKTHPDAIAFRSAVSNSSIQ